MKLLVIWRLLTVGGVNAGWRNRAIFFKQHGIQTDFLYTTDLGGMHIMKDIANVYLTTDEKQIKHLLQDNPYDLVIVVDTGDAFKWLKKANYQGPVLLEARTPEILKLRPHLRNFRGHTPHSMIVPSEYQKRVASILTEDLPVHVIYNGVDTSVFHPVEPLDADPKPAGKKIIGWVGRLDKRKNWRMLLKIASVMQQERDDVEFWVIGGAQSVEREAFAAELENAQMASIVKWFPVIPYQQMPHIYASIRQSGGCYLATTRSESFGNTFIEAMACGVPVVAPNVSSIPEIVRHGQTGRLYREEHVRGAVRQIGRLVDNQEAYQRMSETAVQRVQQHFAIPIVGEQYVQYLKTIVEDPL